MTEEPNQVIQDQAAENLCRWAAARAGMIVVAPGVGTMALVANEIYMIIRIGKAYGVELSRSAAFGFLASLGAAFAGQTLATLVPIAPMQIAVGVSVTYAVGKAAQAWIKAGMPSDMGGVRKIFASVKKTTRTRWQDLTSHPEREVPLGDETANLLLLGPGQQTAETAEPKETVEQKMKGKERLERIAGMQAEVTKRIAKLPLGNELVGPALDYIFNDPHVKQVIDAIQNPRPLRIVFAGRTGAGKSSLINALAGKYLAEVSDPVPGQQQAEKHTILDGDRVLFEVVDTRGIADAGENAEAELEKALQGFAPDIMILAIPLTDRSHVDEDIADVGAIRRKYFDGELPTLILLNKADLMAPNQEPMDSERKQANIRAAGDWVAELVKAAGLAPLAILPVCSYIDWSENKQEIVYDGRYNIERLQQLILENVALDAAMQLAFAGRIQYAVRLVAERFVHACAALAAGIGANPLPVADITVLTGLQVVMVTTVAYLAGRDLDEKGVREFIAGLGFHIPAALALRELARVLSPFFGGVVSGGIASGGTYAIGISAVAYYIDGKPLSALSGIFQAAQTLAGDRIKQGRPGEFK